jgi:hypothetical protein
VAPSFTTNDMANVGLTDAVLARQASTPPARAVRTGEDRAGSILRQFGVALAGSPRVSVMPGPVFHVLPMRSPADVAQAAVGRVAVEVSALLTFRTGADEGFKNKRMDPNRTPDSCTSEGRQRVTGGVRTGDEPSPRARAAIPGPDATATPDTAVGAYSVVWEVGNLAVLDGRIELRHGLLLRREGCVQGRPSGDSGGRPAVILWGVIH